MRISGAPSASAWPAVQDDEALQPKRVQVCGGGVGGSLQLPDLPLGYTLGYEKTNGCPITVRPEWLSRQPALHLHVPDKALGCMLRHN